jgi:hypothetical protein
MNTPFHHHRLDGLPDDFSDSTLATATDTLADPNAAPPVTQDLAVGPVSRETVVQPASASSENAPPTGPVLADSGSAGLVINVNYDSSVTDLASTDPTTFAAFEGAVQTAVQYYESIITNPITVTINVGWGEVMNTSILPGAVGESIAYEDFTTYASVYGALQATGTTSPVQLAAAASLPGSDPTNGASFELTTAEANALGLYAASQFVGGFVGLDSTASWSWSQSNVAADTEDAVGALEHEISEVLGRSDLAGAGGAYTPLDLFRYTAIDGGATDARGTAVGARDEPFVAGYRAQANSYFSYDGATVTLPYETPSDVANGADVGDWAPSVPNDSFADDALDGADVVSTTDLQELNVLGYDIACYAAGTRIATVRGDVAVEALCPGDVVRTVFGGDVPVLWIGQRSIDCTGDFDAVRAWPVRVAVDAFGPGQPNRDLFLSPEHAVFVDTVLIPVKHLINGTTIARAPVDRVTYYHVELRRHDVLFAEGLPAESYLDTGNRRIFTRGAGAITLRPSSGALKTWEDHGAAPLATDEARVKPVWQRLAARAAELGAPVPPIALTDDPAVHLQIDGRLIRPAAADQQRCLFILPPHAGMIRLVSRTGYPTEVRPWADDWRRLGVYVSRIVWYDADGPQDMPVDHPALGEGWWAVEHADHCMRRWTDGDARLPPPPDVRMVEIHLEGGMEYRPGAFGPDSRDGVRPADAVQRFARAA